MGPQGGQAIGAADRGAAVPLEDRSADGPAPTTEIERVFREEYGRAVAVLVRVFGDIDLAEERSRRRSRSR